MIDFFLKQGLERACSTLFKTFHPSWFAQLFLSLPFVFFFFSCFCPFSVMHTASVYRSENWLTWCHCFLLIWINDSVSWFASLPRKRWHLFPPEDTSCMYPTRIPYEESSIFSQVNVAQPDLDRFPAFRGARAHVVTLQPGQVRPLDVLVCFSWKFPCEWSWHSCLALSEISEIIQGYLFGWQGPISVVATF